jgi:NAD(P)-dependent dehydrogenase (short-subunit alcohol dehydrogenase family)
VTALLALAIAVGVICQLAETSRPYPVHASGAVIVTGTHSGLGLLATKALAAHGYDVFATVRRADQLDTWADTPHVHPILLEDVGDLASVESTFEELRSWLADSSDGPRRLVGVVNNAGIGVQMSLDHENYTPTILQQTFAVNVFGPVYVTEAALPLLPAGGRIVNVGSLSLTCTSGGSDPYVATTYALKGLSTSWRRELLDAQISVSYLEPGYFESNMGGAQGVANGAPYESVLALLHAIQSSHPRTHYTTESVQGLPAWFMAFSCWAMPPRWMDSIMHAMFKGQTWKSYQGTFHADYWRSPTRD